MKKTKITENFHMMKNLMKKIFNFIMTGMKMETMPRTISRQKRKSSKKRVKITMMKRRTKKKLRMKKKMRSMKIGVIVNSLTKIIMLTIKIKIKSLMTV